MESSNQSIAQLDIALPDVPDISRERLLQDSLDLFSRTQSGHMLHQCYIGEGLNFWNEYMRQCDDYYITKHETNLILTARDEISQIAQERLAGSLHLVELGTGSRLGLNKTLALCEALSFSSYFPCDWSDDSIELAKAVIKEHYPDVSITGQQADFNRDNMAVPLGGRRLFVVFGSTSSNIAGFPEQGLPIAALTAGLSNIRRNMQEGDILLLGIDQNQDGDMMEHMYSHAMHTAFSENILQRISDELPVFDFNPAAFRYKPKWHPQAHLLSHDLVAVEDTKFQMAHDRFDIKAGKRFSYSNSYKYPDYALNSVFNATQFEFIKKWQSPEKTMSLFALRATIK